MTSALRLTLIGLLLACTPLLAEEDVPYTVASFPEALGNQRARVHVDARADAVLLHIPWRRRDRSPEKKQLTLVDAATGKPVANMVRIDVNRAFADLAFQPATVPGDYYLYYAPYEVKAGVGSYGGNYLPPEKPTAAKDWLERHALTPAMLKQKRLEQLPKASVLGIESRSEFERPDPMEVVATGAEVAGLLRQHPGPFLVFMEDRRFPIRMMDELPLRWIRSGPVTRLKGQADRNEYFAFQVGVFAARQELEDLTLEFGELRSDGGRVIPASALTCFNLSGVDWTGRPLAKRVSVPRGHIQPLWIGVDIPRDAAPGDYRATLTLRPKNAPPSSLTLALAVTNEVRADRGDNETWRHSRLRWLDSKLGIDDQPVAPYTPLQLRDQTIRCLGRSMQLDPTGLPSQIRAGDCTLLASPLAFVAQTADGAHTAIASAPPTITRQSAGVVAWRSESTAGPVSINCAGQMEFDGYVHYTLTCSTVQPVAVSDLRLELPVRRDAAPCFMGVGRKGGLRPRTLDWKWGGRIYYDSFWIGGVPAGLQCELLGASYSGPMVNLYWSMGQLKPPASWSNDGRGGCNLVEDGNTVRIRAYSGARTLRPGQTLTFEFALLITPVKPLDTASHFRNRYYHAYSPVDTVAATGANVINIHHATEINPFINYPFLATDKLREYVDQAHGRGMKVKIYYTVRELTDHCTELFALRSLGHEVLAPGPGGGYPWLREHLVSDYAPAWYHHFDSGDVCAAVVTTGDSRWYNYYIEGLNWLLANTHIDGLYLDDVTYDRDILKRMRRVMNAARPGCLIDLHSNTGFSHQPANQYMKFFPYINRLWFGESFNYDESPDYWLVEISGIPYGLMGEMLQNGGNPWRGMLYGMTARLPWSGNPRAMWQAWDRFGIVDSKMIGYWDPDCPVRTDNPDILATAYVRNGRTLIALASWAKKPAECHLQINFKALGLDPARATLNAGEIKEFQPQRSFTVDQAIPVSPGRGWLLTLQ